MARLQIDAHRIRSNWCCCFLLLLFISFHTHSPPSPQTPFISELDFLNEIKTDDGKWRFVNNKNRVLEIFCNSFVCVGWLGRLNIRELQSLCSRSDFSFFLFFTNLKFLSIKNLVPSLNFYRQPTHPHKRQEAQWNCILRSLAAHARLIIKLRRTGLVHVQERWKLQQEANNL